MPEAGGFTTGILAMGIGTLGDVAAAENLDKADVATAVHALLFLLLEQAGMSGDDLDVFLAEARSMADVWLMRR